MWDVLVYGGVYEVFQVVPVFFEGVGVGVSRKKGITVIRHVSFDRVGVSSGID